VARKVVQYNAIAKRNGATRIEKPTALATMDQTPAHVELLVSIYTPAPYVLPEIMALNTALFNELFPIVTRLKWTAWEAILAKHNLLSTFGDIPIGLQYGFLTGLE
jgi:hypothetical protein